MHLNFAHLNYVAIFATLFAISAAGALVLAAWMLGRRMRGEPPMTEEEESDARNG